MESKKVVVDLQSLDLLEERVTRVLQTMAGLRRERDALRDESRETKDRLERALAENRRLEQEQQGSRSLTDEIDLLKEERQAIRGRVSRLLEMMAELEETPTPARPGH
jgi:predicted  nucleic acid-binding Zn-ribbon protein